MTTRAHVDDTDAGLVARCLGGEAAAWESLVERHGGLVWAVARRAGLDEEDAADVFQNTWTIALEDLSRIREPHHFGRWVGRVARHQAMRVRRRYGIAKKALPHVAREDVDDAVPYEEVARMEERSRVHAALGRLSERCARLLRALYLEPSRPAYSELSARLGVRVGSIGPTRARCLQKLRGLIEGDRHG